MDQQIRTFEELFARIDANGVYLCEDTHTSYWSNFGGGFGRRSTYVEYMKRLVDALHAWHSKSRRLAVSDFTRSVHGMHFYDSVVVIEKRPMPEPATEKTGSASIPDFHAARPRLGKRIERGVKRGLRRLAGKGG
jgi:hypothetical protein